MPTININGQNIHYIQQGKGKWNVVCLHGWGQNIEMMQMITDHLKDKFTVTVLDFPGFGNSQEPKESWSVDDYTDNFSAFLDALEIQNPILIAHSFGCRVAIHYATKKPVHKMVLTGAAGIKPKHGLDWYFRTYSYKAMKKILTLPGLKKYEDDVKKYFGSSDYKNSQGVMRDTFVKVVNDDVTSLLEKVSMPVLLVFGEKDEATPLWMGKMMEEKMPNAGLAVFENDDHYAYWHQWDRFNRCLDVFLKEEGENHE